MGRMHFTVDFTEHLFTQNTKNVFTSTPIITGINTDPLALHLVFDNTVLNDCKAITTTTTCGIWILNQYAALIVDCGLSPCKVWTRVYGQIRANGQLLAINIVTHFTLVPMKKGL